MNTIKIYGGLGNQMFQYAFGRAMLLYNIPACYDLAWFKKPQNPPRPYTLDKFKIELSSVHGNIYSHSMYHEQNYYQYDPILQRQTERYYFGYWQNWKYTISILEILKHEFRVKQEFYTAEYERLRMSILSNKDSVALHIRRGDYLTKGHILLPLDYYKDSMKYLSERGKLGSVYVFSDDIAWCEKYIPDAIFVNIVDYLCLDLMCLCTHKVTANSTFSLWAGVLGEKADSITFAPKRWRLKNEEEAAINEEGFIPSNWIRV